MTRLKSIIILVILSISAYGQNLTDALRYSQLTSGGSARVMGAGGAFGAMGGDFGVTSLNVSGIADYRSSELIFSLSYNQANVTSTHEGEVIGETNDGRETILENIAFIKHIKPYGNLVTSNWAIGLQQYTNYNQTITFNTDTPGSIVERFALDANRDNYSAFGAELADNAGAIFFEPDPDPEIEGEMGLYLNDPLGNAINKNQVIERSGRINELVFNWAGMYENGLRIGAGIGIPFVNFEENKFYTENDTDDSPEDFNRLNYNESLSTSGIGWNFKLGIGYSIKKKIRLGLGVQSPTWMRLDDDFSTSLLYDCGACSATGTLFESIPGFFEYKLRTPARLTASIGYLLLTDDVKGFINLDAQFIDYTQNSFNFTDNNDDPNEVFFQNEVNGEINNELRNTINYNLGAELAYKKIRGRAGISLQASPFFLDSNFDKIYSAGFGYRLDNIFIDFAYQFRSFSEGYVPYLAPTEAGDLNLINDTNVNKFIMTLGFKL